MVLNSEGLLEIVCSAVDAGLVVDVVRHALFDEVIVEVTVTYPDGSRTFVNECVADDLDMNDERERRAYYYG